MVCNIKWDNPLGAEERYDGAVTNDYLEAISEFIDRQTVLLGDLKDERTPGFPFQKLTDEYCTPGGLDMDLEGKRLTPRMDTKEAEYLTDEQIHILLDKLEKLDEKKMEYKYKVAFVLALFSGCRRGECNNLKWSDINCAEKTIRINKSTAVKAGKGAVEKSTKNDSSNREVFVPQLVIDMLKEFRQRENARRAKKGLDCSDNSYVFLGKKTNTLMTPNAITNNFKRLRDLIPELGNTTVHGLRHSNASMKLRNGIDMVTIARDLGHANAVITSKIYAHVNKEDREKARNKIEEVYCNKTKSPRIFKVNKAELLKKLGKSPK